MRLAPQALMRLWIMSSATFAEANMFAGNVSNANTGTQTGLDFTQSDTNNFEIQTGSGVGIFLTTGAGVTYDNEEGYYYIQVEFIV